MLLQLSKTVKQSPKSPQIFENNGTFCADRPFSKNRSETNCQKSFVFNQLVSELQSYILSTTTETTVGRHVLGRCRASIVHPFNNNWNKVEEFATVCANKLQSYILSTTTETSLNFLFSRVDRLQSYILSTTTETISEFFKIDFFQGFNRTSFQQQLKLTRKLCV